MGSKYSCSGSLSLVSQLLPLSIARTLNDAGAAIAQTPLVGEMQVPPPRILPWTALCISRSLRPKSTTIAVATPAICHGCFDSQGSEFIISAFSVLRLFCCSNTPPLPPKSLLQGFWCSLSVNNSKTLFYVVLLYLRVLKLGMAPSLSIQASLSRSFLENKNLCPMSGRPPDFVTGEREQIKRLKNRLLVFSVLSA